MTIKDFLNKWKASGKNQLSTLKYEKERLSNEMLYQMKRVNEVRNWKYNLQKITDIWGLLIIIIGFFGSMAGAFGVIPLQPFIYSIFAIGGVSFVGYKIAENILDSKNPSAYYSVSNERAEMSRKLRECQEKINEFEKVMEEVRKTDEFFEVLNRKSVINDSLPTLESQILFYIKENMSLLSILYLSKRKMLPGDVGHPLTLEELEKVKLLGKKLDEKFENNPEYFVLDENNRVNNQNEGRVRKSRVERNRELENYFVEEEKHRSR